MAGIKPITFYNHASGPNPKKVLIVMEELGLAYEKIDIADPKEESFTAINPNGRLPAIKDPNTDMLLWESGAIMEYLVETYDKEGKLKGANSKENYLAKQYLFFQMSGQGPYFGQYVWYSYFDQTNPEARKRYAEQTERVLMVLNNILKGKKYLVGEKITYADIAFISWNATVQGFKETWDSWEVEKKYPDFWAWHTRLMERPTVKKVM
ncbi:glutathione S-transferase [Sarocladium strictum]